MDSVGARLGSMAQLPFGRRPRAHDGNAARPPALRLLDSHESGSFNRGAAEIVDYHAPSGRAFVVNAKAAQVDVLELGARGFGGSERALEPRRDIQDFAAGPVTSLAIAGDLVAVAVCAESNERRGRVAFYRARDLSYLGAVTVGYVPDMLTFTPDGTRVLVANEGEQVRSAASQIVADPEGSVSIIDVSRGVDQASVAHARFDGFDARIEEYRSVGVRIPRLADSFFEAGEGEVRLSRDLEPEYIAVAADGKTAWVSLQENNAIAVLDIAAASFRDLLPLGGKDFSRGLPSLETHELTSAESPLRGLWFEPLESNPGAQVFYLLHERALSRQVLEGDRAGEPRTIALPDVSTGMLELRGLARDESNGSFWVGDARRAALYEITPDGRLARELALGAAPLEPGQTSSSSRTSARAATRLVAHSPDRAEAGVVAIALDRVRHRLYALLQTPAALVGEGGRVVRIVAIDVDRARPSFGTTLGEYLYLLDAPGHGSEAGVGGAALTPEGQLLVLERGAVGKPGPRPAVFRVDLTGASNVSAWRAPDGVPLEACGADELVAAYGVVLAHKQKLYALPDLDNGRASADGLALLGDGRLALALAEGLPSRVDEASAGAEADEGRLSLGLVSFDEQNRFDASDRDGAVQLRHWPVLGGYMPDGIEALRLGGADYLVTANEGDTRDYDAKRLADVELDPSRFPQAVALQSSASLGRLKISALDGDLDRDGDLDELHAFGARSLSVWDRFGDRVFDTGSLFEDVTAMAVSSAFNSNNDANGSFDTRSDNKGPEPEGLEVAEIDGRVYAFVGLERVGGIVVLDLTNPRDVAFVEYVNPRDFAGDATRGAARDLGPEGLKFVPAAQSPTGRGLLLVANEVSGTTSAYDVNL